MVVVVLGYQGDDGGNLHGYGSRTDRRGARRGGPLGRVNTGVSDGSRLAVIGMGCRCEMARLDGTCT